LPKSIAIDGPGGAGKSVLGKALAQKLGYMYVDTGSAYRAVAFYVLKKRGASFCEEDVRRDLSEIRVGQQLMGSQTKTYLNGENISADIRHEEVTMAASRISGFKSVRDFLLEMQRGMARQYNVVMDGRDIGTVVLPNADFKLFLTASCEVRARRRVLQLKKSGQQVDIKEVLKKLQERDSNDMNRVFAPLKVAASAVLFDNSERTFNETLEQVYKLVKWELT
jgi:cytidylate kinase